MKNGRFFVTSVLVFATLFTAACHSKKETKASLLQEGAQKLSQSDDLVADLNKQYRIKIIDLPEHRADGTTVDSVKYGSSYNWRRLSLADRQVAKEKLAKLITVLSRVLEIDARKGIFVDHINKVQSRYRGALAFQTKLNEFEELYGEQVDLKGTENERIYSAPIEP